MLNTLPQTIGLLLSAAFVAPAVAGGDDACDASSLSCDTRTFVASRLVSSVAEPPVKADVATSFHAVMVHSDSRTGEVKVEIRNDDISAWVNGEPVPADLIRRDGASVSILDADGNVLNSFPMVVARNDGASRVWLHSGPPDGGMIFAPGRPRIGVTMGPLDAALREHLDIEDEGAFVITDVIRGLPAEKAGVQRNDVVVRINGESASEDRLRELVGAAKEGDRITLRVLRKGEAKEITITLDDDAVADLEIAPHNPHEFRFVPGDIGLERMFHDGFFDAELFRDGRFDPEAMRRHLEEMMRDGRLRQWTDRFEVELLPQLREFNLDDPARLRLRLEEARELPARILREIDLPAMNDIATKILESLKDVELDAESRRHVERLIKESLGEAMNEMRGRFRLQFREGDHPHMFELFQPKDGEVEGGVIILHEQPARHTLRLRPRQGEGGAIEMQVEIEEVPAPPGAPAPAAVRPGDDRLRALEERMQRLEQLLERIAERIDR